MKSTGQLEHLCLDVAFVLLSSFKIFHGISVDRAEEIFGLVTVLMFRFLLLTDLLHSVAEGSATISVTVVFVLCSGSVVDRV